MGAALTIVMAVKITTSPLGAKWKLLPTYGASSTILVTQSGDPLGRTLNQLSQATASTRFVDPSRFEYLAVLYAQLATTDAVVKSVVGPQGFERNGTLFLDNGAISGTYTAGAVPDPSGNSNLPFIEIDSSASSPAAALAIGRRATSGLVAYIRNTQGKASVQSTQRVVLSVVQSPLQAKEIKGRGLVLPLVIFMFCVFGAIALAFFVENLSTEESAERVVAETSAVHSYATARQTVTQRQAAGGRLLPPRRVGQRGGDGPASPRSDEDA